MRKKHFQYGRHSPTAWQAKCGQRTNGENRLIIAIPLFAWDELLCFAPAFLPRQTDTVCEPGALCPSGSSHQESMMGHTRQTQSQASSDSALTSPSLWAVSTLSSFQSEGLPFCSPNPAPISSRCSLRVLRFPKSVSWRRWKGKGDLQRGLFQQSLLEEETDEADSWQYRLVTHVSSVVFCGVL